jgi:hypothetical protein
MEKVISFHSLLHSDTSLRSDGSTSSHSHRHRRRHSIIDTNSSKFRPRSVRRSRAATGLPHLLLLEIVPVFTYEIFEIEPRPLDDTPLQQLLSQKW